MSSQIIELYLLVFISAVILVLAIYLCKIIYSYSYFKKRGIKTPKYKYFSGNYQEILRKSHTNALRDWSKELGKVYGYYEGHRPILVTTDIEMVQEIFVNKINNFSGRKLVPFLHNDKNAPLFMSSGNEWRRFRTIINPTFSPSKLKYYLESIRKCSDRFFDLIEQHEEKEFNVHSYINSLAMDITWNCAYGLDIDCQNDRKNPFVINTHRLINNLNSSASMVLALIYYYELKPIILPIITFVTFLTGKIHYLLGNPAFWILNKTKSIIEKRINIPLNQSPKKDYIYALMECLNEKNDDVASVNLNKNLTVDEISTQLTMFNIAGMETITTTLCFCIYSLLKHPEEIKKIQNEIDQKFDFTLQKDEDIYENIVNLEYLDMFIKEVMRFYPVATTPINRRCIKETTVKGIKIQKEQIITTDVLSLHFDQECWGTVDVNQFYPLRFKPDYKKNDTAYMPFGAGQKECVGKKFALLEMKYVLIKLFKKYDLVATNEIKELELNEVLVRRPKNGMKCMFKLRKAE